MRNSFYLLEQNCLSNFNTYCKECDISGNFSDAEKARYGFYFFVLKTITGIDDYHDIEDMIIDYDFNNKILHNGFDDRGVDAVYIEENKISLFNFKYRDPFKVTSGQSENEFRASEKFIEDFVNSNTTTTGGKPLKLLKELIQKANKPGAYYDIDVYYVSNECNSLGEVDKRRFKELKREYSNRFNVDIKLISLKELSCYFGFSHKKIDCCVNLPEIDCMPFREKDRGSKTSFILTVPLCELLRMTSSVESQRMELAVSEEDNVADYNLNFNVLYENVRGFLGQTTFNSSIKKTIEENPEKFFLYNNGLTITASKVEAKPNTGKNLKLTLYNMQIVNGGQTLRTLFSTLKELNNAENFKKAKILVRVFEVGEYSKSSENELGNEIAKYTNSQNKITNVDLKSLDKIQFDLETLFSSYGILYKRKRGDIGLSPDGDCTEEISSERYGQIVWSIEGYPHKAANSKSQIFDTEYDNIFVNNFDISKGIDYYLAYLDIKERLKKYKKQKIDEQKVFYLLYAYVSCGITKIEKLYEDLLFLEEFYKSNSQKNKDRPYIKPAFFELWKKWCRDIANRRLLGRLIKYKKMRQMSENNE